MPYVLIIRGVAGCDHFISINTHIYSIYSRLNAINSFVAPKYTPLRSGFGFLISGHRRFLVFNTGFVLEYSVKVFFTVYNISRTSCIFGAVIHMWFVLHELYTID